jgi:hypothetical protein
MGLQLDKLEGRVGESQLHMWIINERSLSLDRVSLCDFIVMLCLSFCLTSDESLLTDIASYPMQSTRRREVLSTKKLVGHESVRAEYGGKMICCSGECEDGLRSSVAVVVLARTVESVLRLLEAVEGNAMYTSTAL